MATVRVSPATVYVIEPAFALVKVRFNCPAVETRADAGLNAPSKNVGPFTSYSDSAQLPLDAAAGSAQCGATYHFGLPAPSYVYQVAKTMLTRCTKCRPHPDSPEFHHWPLNEAG